MKRFTFLSDRAVSVGVRDDGEWVRHADAVEALAAKDAEIARLRAALAAIEAVLGAAELTHGGDLRGLDEVALEEALKVRCQ